MSKKSKKNTASAKKTKYYIHQLKPQIEISGFEFCSLEDIDKIKNNSATEIFIYDLLEYIPYEDLFTVYQEILKKLAKNGIIHIHGTDLRSLCLSVLDGQINSGVFRSILFGYHKRNIMSISDIKLFIGSYPNLVIQKIKFLNGLQYYIECLSNE